MGVGLGWSFLNNVLGRLGSFLSGIVIVRLLVQEQFGTYAVGLTVLTVILSLNDLGVSVAVVQHPGRPQDVAPTVMTLSIASSAALAAGGFFAAPLVAAAMSAPEAAGLIRLMMLCVLLDGIAAVPNAVMSRLFLQRKRMMIDIAAFSVGTPVTVFLAASGHGALSLGWGAVLGNATTALLALALNPIKVLPGWDWRQLHSLLSFGVPLAGASLLLLLMLNVDKIVVGHTLGPTALGLYALAFNLCSWPIVVITSAIRRVAVPLFSRLDEHSSDRGREGFEVVSTLVTAVAAPLCLLLAGYATVLIETLYGAPWLGSAAALGPLVIFSLVRVWVELVYDFMAGRGRSGPTVWLHAIWLAALVPSLVVGVRIGGIKGAAVAQATVSLLVVLPALWWLLRGDAVSVSRIARRALPVWVGLALLATIVVVSRGFMSSGVIAMLSGSVCGLVAYAFCVWPLRRDAVLLWNLKYPVGSSSASEGAVPVTAADADPGRGHQ